MMMIISVDANDGNNDDESDKKICYGKEFSAYVPELCKQIWESKCRWKSYPQVFGSLEGKTGSFFNILAIQFLKVR